MDIRESLNVHDMPHLLTLIEKKELGILLVNKRTSKSSSK